MVRPRRGRWVNFEPNTYYFKPQGIPLRELEDVYLSLDELEAIRLCDSKGLDQNVAAKEMRVSQSTLQRTLSSARSKIAEALVNGKAIKINR